MTTDDRQARIVELLLSGEPYGVCPHCKEPVFDHFPGRHRLQRHYSELVYLIIRYCNVVDKPVLPFIDGRNDKPTWAWTVRSKQEP